MSVPGLLQDEELPEFVKTLENREIMETARSEGMSWLEGCREPERLFAGVRRVLHVTASADAQYLERLYPRRKFSFDAGALPEPFPAPTLILTGRQDSVCGYGGAWELLEHFARATFAVLDGAGHMMWGEQPAVCSALVSEMAGPCRARLSAPSDFSKLGEYLADPEPSDNCCPTCRALCQ